MNRRHFISSSIVSSVAYNAIANAQGAAKMRVGVIGHTGRGNFGHGLDTMWRDIPETEIVAVADADEKGLAAELKKLKVEKGFADYRKMLTETKPEIVSIGPRHVDQHRDMALAAIEAGVKGIYMEKPFCRTLAEADEIIAAANKTGTKIALAHRNRYHPVMPHVVQLMKDGAIGKVLEYRARGKEDARGGSLDMWVLGSHLFNLMHFFMGEPQAVSALVLKNGAPITKADIEEGAEGLGPLAGNEVHARFEMQNALPGFFDSVQNSGSKAAGFGIQIIGTEGIIDLRTDAEPAAQILAGSPFGPNNKPRTWVPITTGGVGKPEPIKEIRLLTAGHVAPGRDLIAAIKENRAPLCSAEDARVILEMTMGVFESHRLNGQRVTLPLKDRGHPLAKL
ncbi:MAG TPA: Gfo/Idh/MocA family oxidoreductase [Prosthecobacter sp.]|nr:Gfo/Idh/MocA family oxidoreductase [Prosthecobacter sp.]